MPFKVCSITKSSGHLQALEVYIKVQLMRFWHNDDGYSFLFSLYEDYLNFQLRPQNLPQLNLLQILYI